MKNNCLFRRVCNPLGVGGLAAAQAPSGYTRLFQRGAVRGFKTGKVILVLAAILAATPLLPSLHAGVIYTAGTETVGPGGNVSVPITVSSTVTPPSVNWLNAGFNLTWDSSVLILQPTPVDLTGSPLPLTLGNFHSPSAGQLNFTWSAADFGNPVPNGSTLFTVNFTAVGGLGTSTSVSFNTLATIGLDDSSGKNFTDTTPTFSAGGVSVVPEPVNWALGLFACVFIGSATVRWISRRQTSLQSL